MSRTDRIKNEPQLLPAAAADSAVLAVARTSFLLDEPVAPGVVRPPILASWKRSRLWDVPTERPEPPFDDDLDLDTLLTRASDLVLADVAEQLAAEPVSLILCDSRGTVLQRRTGDSHLEQYLDRVQLAPGFSYAESHVGTNGIGTALEDGGSARVFGHEHYLEHLENLACAGAPIRHPLTGKTVGVVDLTCWHKDAGMMMGPTVATMAARIEQLLLEQSGRRELALLHDYRLACHRNRGAVLAVGDNLLMLNDRAREMISPGDQTPLIAHARDALASGVRQLVVELPSGLTVRVLCKPTFIRAPAADGVLQVLPLAGVSSAGGHNSLPQRLPLPTLVGSAPAWTRCCQTVDRHSLNGEWLVLAGEPGTGKVTLARAAHQRRNPAGHLRVLDADDYGPQWLADVIEEVETGGGTLVLTHVDRLPEEGVLALAEALEPHRESTHVDRAWVVITMTHPSPDAVPGLAALLQCFPTTVAVPPLRHHVEDVTELVPHLLSRARAGALSCSPAAMSALMRNAWPGNVEQLARVLHKVTAKRRAGVVDVADLPPECLSTRRWVLTPLEAMECDAIVAALAEAGGNKVEAARALGMSRATMYRKIRGYGISTSAACATLPSSDQASRDRASASGVDLHQR
ncbi:MAG: GAF domain-containing protein [Actinobacteria bacterium]|nr:GAF domain-containing protein [Actinomycetota bacterium]